MRCDIAVLLALIGFGPWESEKYDRMLSCFVLRHVGVVRDKEAPVLMTTAFAVLLCAVLPFYVVLVSQTEQFQ